MGFQRERQEHKTARKRNKNQKEQKESEGPKQEEQARNIFGFFESLRKQQEKDRNKTRSKYEQV